jgi:hypothetical protein
VAESEDQAVKMEVSSGDHDDEDVGNLVVWWSGCARRLTEGVAWQVEGEEDDDEDDDEEGEDDEEEEEEEDDDGEEDDGDPVKHECLVCPSLSMVFGIIMEFLVSP